MNTTSDPRISQILPTVKCSDCGLPVELRKLGEHVCSSAPPLPPLKTPSSIPRDDRSHDNQENLSLPFLEKYSKMTGKAMNTLRTAAAAAPSLSEGLYKTLSSKTAPQTNGSTNERKQTFDSPTSHSPRDPIPDPPPKNTSNDAYEGRPTINTGTASRARSPPSRNNSGDDYYSSSPTRYLKDNRNIDPILEDEDAYHPSQPVPTRSTRNDRYDDYSSRKPQNPATSRNKGPFFLGNLSQENVNHPRKNSYTSYNGNRRRSDDEDYYGFDDGRNSPYHDTLRHDASPSRSSSGDEVSSPKTPGSSSYRDEVSSPKTPGPSSYRDDFSNSRFNFYDSRTDASPPGARRPSIKNKQDIEVLDSLMADLMKDVDDDFDTAPMTPPIPRQVAPKPRELVICTVCHTAINSRELIHDLDRKPYHRDCLSCTLCRAELGDGKHYEFENKFYCERDYNVVRRRVICAACDHPIASTAKSIKALGGQYHVGHLKCHHCREPVDKETTGFVEHKGRVFCRHDFKELYLPKCAACRKPVEREAVSAADGKLKGKWHRECFGCHTCRRPFPNNTFYVFESLPYCKRHYHRLNNSLCRQCDEPIEGPCAQTAEGWRFHPPCFTCQACRCAITDIYYMLDNQIYCETHIGHIQRKKNMRAEKRRTQFGRI